LIEDRLGSYLDGILSRLEIEPFPVASYEIQVTASNDGDFFNAHGDNHQVANAARSLSFVYFFHGEPRAFEGGQLVFHYSGREMSITPVQGVLVAFPPGISHEIRPVKCSSRRFADSRFTLNGWVRRAS
jgi:SM-20-related protein